MALIHARKSLHLASLNESGAPHASCAPYGMGANCLYVLLSELAHHGLNLQRDPRASVLIIEDEATSRQVFARERLSYDMQAVRIDRDDPQWQEGVAALQERFGEFPTQLTQLQDFILFRLMPIEVRFIKGFGRAYRLAGNSLAGDAIEPLGGI